MSDLWQSLKIGDKVRLIEWPFGLDEDRLDPDTLAFYRWLIETGSVLDIVEIDDLAMPTGLITRLVDGVKRWDFLLLNHGGLEIVTREESEGKMGEPE